MCSAPLVETCTTANSRLALGIEEERAEAEVFQPVARLSPTNVARELFVNDLKAESDEQQQMRLSLSLTPYSIFTARDLLRVRKRNKVIGSSLILEVSRHSTTVLCQLLVVPFSSFPHSSGPQ